MALIGYAVSPALKPQVAKIIDSEHSVRALKSRILVVDDDWGVRETLTLLLIRAGYQASMAENGVDALQQIQKQAPTVLLCDMEMPRMSGFELLPIVRSRFPWVAVIAMSGSYADGSVPDGVMADGFYCKGTQGPPDLFRLVAEVIRSSASGRGSCPEVDRGRDLHPTAAKPGASRAPRDLHPNTPKSGASGTPRDRT